ncbi:NADH-quinone oxidoreductase subunit N [Microlunatus kandeliicorticis]|nr:NADH-quinone oxidoreductase subunit N [Microlunatus kandeliicorticis]
MVPQMASGADVLGLLPELWLVAGALVVLLAGSFLPRRRLNLARLLTLVSCAGSLGSTTLTLGRGIRTVFEGNFAIDHATTAVRLIAVGATAIVVLLAGDELAGSARQAELCVLLLLATTGTLVLAGAQDLLLVITGFLLASVPLYALVGLTRTPLAAEASLKTYLFGSLSGIVLMAGVTVLYGLGGRTDYPGLEAGLATAPTGPLIVGTVALFAGLMFKIGAVPGHFWVPDAAQGSGVLAASYLTTVPKIGALVAAFRLVTVLPGPSRAALLVAILAVVTMTLGNLAAFSQNDPQRLLGWSTVSQAGYLLVPVAMAGRSGLATGALVVYLAGYAVTNLAAFAVIAAVPGRRTLTEYTGLAGRQPWLAGALLVALLGLVGTPPAAVFAGKLAITVAAWEGGDAWLALVVLLNSLLSLFYYLRWIAPLVRSGRPVTSVRRWGATVAVAVAGLSVLLGIASALLWRVIGAG